jgi:glyoxylase-like metal-dependent hydrolase (beta-lactamase superfamily II)
LEGSQWPQALPRPGNQRLKRLVSTARWFAVYKVCTGTFALLEPRHYEEVISYLIMGDDRALLLDTGMGIGDIQAEVEHLTRLPVIVVNSHSHYDHVGDNHRFSDVWAFDDESEVARIEGGLGPDRCAGYLAPGSYLDLPVDFDPQTYAIHPSPVTRRLHHLDTIALGGRTLTVHHTPGHSPGSICLLDERQRLLFTGDTFYPGMLYAHFPDSDFDRYIQSFHYLVGLLDQVDHLCPAHNEAYVPKEMLIRTLDSFEQIAAGRAPFEIQDGIRVYRFEGFGVTLPHTDKPQ